MPCSRCSSTTFTTASVELRRGAHTQLHLLCTWCADEVMAVLASPASADYDDMTTMHTADCKCDACDPDFHMEYRRDEHAA